MSIGKATKGHRPLISFTSFDRARNYLITLVKTHELHPELCSLPASMMKYFGYSFSSNQKENEVFNQRLLEALEAIKADSQTYCLLGKGRSYQERSVVLVEKGKYKGFGFYEDDQAFETVSAVRDIIQEYPDSPDVQRIINQFIEKRQQVKLEAAPEEGMLF